jgi:SAM-dependent methyltransferase
MTVTDASLDHVRVEAFAGELLSGYVATMTTFMVAVGVQSGALDALADAPATSAELAERAGLSERQVREWLGALATSGIAAYDPTTQRYRLAPEHAACLTGGGIANLAPLGSAVAFLGRYVPAVSRTLREGGGIPYREYLPEFHQLQDQLTRRTYDAVLIDGYLPRVDGLASRLTAGAVVADVGCGSGHAANLLARAFPASTFVGYDISPDAIDAARREAAAWGLINARFEVRDVATLPADARFDVVTAFDAIHDQVHPRQVLSEVRRVLGGDGTFVMVEGDASSNVEDNIGNPVAPLLYGISLMHCVQVSLAEGGEGLGGAWGRQLAIRMLHDAGFGDAVVVDTPSEDPVNVIYVARP